MTVDYFRQGEQLLAIVVRREFSHEGIKFFTESDSSQQLGYMKRPAGYKVEPHRHHEAHRGQILTQEVLFVRSGLCRLDLYGQGTSVHLSVELREGDVVLLASGGHGLEMLESTEIIEVKQGPYSGDSDKTRFIPGEASV